MGHFRQIGTLSKLTGCPLRSESDRRRSKCDPSLSADFVAKVVDAFREQ
jgi:hypothetical protein